MQLWNLLPLAYEKSMTAGEAFNVSLTGIVVVLLVLALLAILVQLLSKSIRLFEGKGKKEEKNAAPAPTVAAKPAGTPLPENNSVGSLDLNDVDEKTAAVIMAIVSNESGIPLNRLDFKSIKKVER